MKLSEKSRFRLLQNLSEWHEDAYYANRSNFECEEDGVDKGKNYIQFIAMYRIIKKLIKEARWAYPM